MRRTKTRGGGRYLFWILAGVLAVILIATQLWLPRLLPPQAASFTADDADYFYVLAYSSGEALGTVQRLTSSQCLYIKKQVEAQHGWETTCVPVPWVAPEAPPKKTAGSASRK
jgi:hypothetical protein